MAGRVTARAIRTHEPFLSTVAIQVGDAPFLARDLRAQGVAVPSDQDLRQLRETGCLVRLGRSRGSTRWRLAAGVLALCREGQP
ncbi:MAG: hypothetical protein WC277_11700 [Bacilli bacterium]|jgi:hypothetical protein